MKTYELAVTGCDDCTCVQLTLTDEQFALLDYVSKKVTDTSTCSCMPVMRISETEAK
jgi:hypothetical protein